MLTKSNKACFYPEVHFRSWQGICAQSATTANRKCTRNKFEYFRKLFFKVLLNLPPGTVVQWVRVNQWPYKYKLQLRTWVNSGSDARIELIFIYVVSFICLWAKSSKIKWLLREQACYWPLITGLPLVAVHLSVQLHHLWSWWHICCYHQECAGSQLHLQYWTQALCVEDKQLVRLFYLMLGSNCFNN